jgi:hypothetical protein
MRESLVEKRLVRGVLALGGRADKFVSPGRRGVPDRLVMLPGGILFFVECKAPNRKPNPSQCRDHQQRRRLGFRVEIVNCIEDVDDLLAEFR